MRMRESQLVSPRGSWLATWPAGRLAGQLGAPACLAAGRLAEGNHLENTPTLLTWLQRGAQNAPRFGGV